MKIDAREIKKMKQKVYGSVVVVPLVLQLPMLVGNQKYFMDWVNNFWILKNSGGQYPQFFMSGSALGPLNAFLGYYGGNLFNLIYGFNSFFVGNLEFTYRFTYLLGGLGVSFGAYLFARSFSISRPVSCALSTGMTCTPYLLTNEYARGDFTEYLAFCAFVLMLGSFSHYYSVAGKRERFIDLFLFFISSFIFLSAHILSLVMGSFFIFVCVLIFAPTYFKNFKWLKTNYKKLHFWMPFLILMANLFLDLPYLMLILRTASRTAITQTTSDTPAVPQISSWSEILIPFAHVNSISKTPGLSAQPQNLFLIVILAGTFSIIFKRKLRVDRYSIASGYFLVFACYCVTSIPVFWKYLPFFLKAIQFPYRFVSYVDFALFLLAIIVLRISDSDQIGKRKTRLSLGIFIFSVVSVLCGILQIGSIPTHPEYPSLKSLTLDRPPITWYAGQHSYAYPGTLSVDTPNATILSSALEPGGQIWKLRINCIEGKLIQLPTFAAPPAIHIYGAEYVGTTKHGNAVIRTSKCMDDISNVSLEENAIYPIQLVRLVHYFILFFVFILLGFYGLKISRK